MSSNDPLFNNTNGSLPSITAPVQVAPYDAAPGIFMDFPYKAPFVNAPNVVPGNVEQAYHLQAMNSLAGALGSGQINIGGLGEAAGKYLEKKQAQNNAKLEASGALEYTQKAAQSRNLQADQVSGGLQPSSSNPWFQQGFHAMSANSMSASYRQQLTAARLANPTADPQQLQGQIKQQFLPALQQAGRPDIMYKYFVEPSQKVDEDDFNSYKTEESKVFWDSTKTAVSQSLDGTLASTGSQLAAGKVDLPRFQSDVVKTAEDQLAVAFAHGMPYQPYADAIADTVIDRASLQESLKDKMDYLGTLDQMKTPDGKRLIDLPGIMDKFTKAHEKLTADAIHQELETKQALTYSQQLNTNAITGQLTKDNQGNQGGVKGTPRPLAYYLDPKNFKDSNGHPLPPGSPLDVDKIITTFNAINHNAPEVTQDVRDKATIEVLKRFDAGENPEAILTSLHQKKLTHGLDQDGVNQAHAALDSAIEYNKAVKQFPMPAEPATKLLTNYVQFQAPVSQGYSLSHFTGKDFTTQDKAVTKDLQDKYYYKLQRDFVNWATQNPQGSRDPGQAYNHMDAFMRSQAPSIQKDMDDIMNHRGSYTQIRTRDTGADPTVQAQPKQVRQIPVNHPDLSFLRDQKSWPGTAVMYDAGKGPLADFVRANGRAAGRSPADIEKTLKTKSPDWVLMQLEKSGVPTFHTTTQAAPSGGKK